MVWWCEVGVKDHTRRCTCTVYMGRQIDGEKSKKLCVERAKLIAFVRTKSLKSVRL